MREEVKTEQKQLIDYAATQADRKGWQFRFTEHGDGRVWVEFAAEIVVGGCRNCNTNKNGPTFTLIEDGRFTGGIGGQCSGCGSMGRGWVTFLGRVDSFHEIDELVDYMKVRERQEFDSEREFLQGRMDEMLAGALDELRSGVTPEDLTDYRGMPEPGVFVENGEVVAWTFAPGHHEGDDIVEAVASIPDREE